MTTGILYRVASSDDAAAIATLHATSWRRTYRGVFRDEFLDGPIDEERRSTWQSRLSSGNEQQFVAVAVVDDRVQGFVCAYSQCDDGWGVFIDNLHVAASFQSTGLGTGLLRSVATWACVERRNLPPYLWVLEPNVRAARFYERRGALRREAIVRDNPGGGTATYLRYAWPDALQMASACRDRAR
jgi:GNAT superfamily N-acetyltransferase